MIVKGPSVDSIRWHSSFVIIFELCFFHLNERFGLILDLEFGIANLEYTLANNAMKTEEAKALIEEGVAHNALYWADLGAGSGTFTLALDEIIGFGGVIFAVDLRLDILREKIRTQYFRAKVHLYEESFTDGLKFLPKLDGIVMANSLHYIQDQKKYIGKLFEDHLKRNGVLIVVEYDRVEANQWVPYPLPLAYLERHCLAQNLQLPSEVGRIPSIYGNQDIYAAVCCRNQVLDQ